MNVHCKRGFVAMLLWNLFLLLPVGINSLCTGNGPSFHLFGDEIGNAAYFFLALWSLAWFFVGWQGSREYTAQKAAFAAQYPDVDERLLTPAFRKAYFARYFKYIYRVLAVMTFFYGAAYWEHFTTRTGVYITCFMLASLVCYHYHRKWQVEEMN